MRMLHQHVGELFQFRRRIGRAGRVRGRVEDDPLGLFRDRLVERVGLQLEAVLKPRFDRHRRAACEQHNVRIGHPIRRGNDHLVAGVRRCDHRIEDDRLAARRDEGLVRLVVEPVLALELGADRRLELRDTVDRRILRLALTDGPDRGFLDVVGRVEIGFTGRKRDHVAAQGFQVARFLRGGNGCRRLNAVERVRDKAHFEAPWRGRTKKRAKPKPACSHAQQAS